MTVPNITVYVPPDLYELLKRYPKLNKSRIVAAALRRRIQYLERRNGHKEKA